MPVSPRRPYEDTKTSVADSQASIRSILRKSACTAISFHDEQPADDITAVYVEFRHKENGADYEYRLRVPVDMKALQRKTGETWEKAETRELMRVCPFQWAGPSLRLLDGPWRQHEPLR